jgi:hypothetical protein
MHVSSSLTYACSGHYHYCYNCCYNATVTGAATVIACDVGSEWTFVSHNYGDLLSGVWTLFNTKVWPFSARIKASHFCIYNILACPLVSKFAIKSFGAV